MDKLQFNPIDLHYFGYRAIGILGRGGMGEVWRGRSSEGHDVAIKIQPGGRRVVLEARIQSKLEHSNILRLHKMVSGLGWDSLILPRSSLGDLLEEDGAFKEPLMQYPHCRGCWL